MLRQLPTVRLQLAGLALLAVLLPLSVVLLSGWVMFHMGDDVKILAVTAASASTASSWRCSSRGRSDTGSTDSARRPQALAAGDLGARAPEDGPAELAELARSFNEMAANLSTLFDARRELVAWASHDLRTPIASLQAMLEAVEDGLAAPEAYLPAMSEQVRTLARLVEDLFELARIDAGVLTLELRKAELAGLIETCVRGLGAEAQAKHVTVEARVERRHLGALSPRSRSSACCTTCSRTQSGTHRPTARWQCSSESDPREVRIVVEDTGDGLTPEATERMFERFWRGDGARTADDGGAGLGLAIARGLVEAHGGRIWAECRPEGGTRVSFTLPAEV